MSPPASLDAATAAATETLLNCYLREGGRWRVEDDVLHVELPDIGAELRTKVRYLSPTRRHRYHLPVELATAAGSAPVAFPALAGLLLDALDREAAGAGAGTAAMATDATRLLARMLDSLHNVAGFLEARRTELDRLWSSEPLGFIESEQALLLGHPLHPTPKSRQPMTAPEVARFSPETAAGFQLRWLAVPPAMVRQGSAAPDPAAVLSAGLAERCGVPGEILDRARAGQVVLLPAHPWELDHLLSQPAVAGLLDGAGRDGPSDLGAWGPPVTPTTSVRTVYRADWPWQLKFSLHVRVTNSERVSLPKELDRAVEAARLWQTGVGREAARIAPRFRCVHDPAHLTLVHEGRVLDGFSVLLRENPWPGPARSPAGENVSSLTSLCQDHPLGGPSRLARIVQARAAAQSRRPAEVGREWFAGFLDVAVRSLIRLYADLGLCFEPHQQNTLLELDRSGAPVRCWYRDSQGYFHRELAHEDLCRTVPALGEASESVFPEALADERLVYYPFMNLTLGVVNALGAGGAADEAELLADLRRCLEEERAAGGRYPTTLLDRLLDDERWPCKGNLRTRLHDLDELVGDIETQSVYVTVPNPILDLRTSP